MNGNMQWKCVISMLFLLFPYVVEACTVIAVGRNASIDGSILIGHTDDAGGGAADIRLVRVPAMDHAPNTKRAVYNFDGGYPRLVSNERGPGYIPMNEESLMTPMGYISQVPHTFAYWDQDYGMMNEHQLSIGESTCGAKTVGWPLNAGKHGLNLFGIAELTKIALERCESAICAIETMGSLAVEYGFYSEDSGDPSAPDYGDSAEALSISDKYGQVWIFHILTGPNHQSAIWAAQRVPDDHVTALANGFTIRTMDLNNTDWYRASPNVEETAIALGWYDPSSKEPFDFTSAFGFADKDAIGPLYTGRRLWRIYDVLAPSKGLDPTLGSFSTYETYPFSIKPDALVDISTVMELMRDHYEGTPYDMTKGLAAGPFGSPVRWSGSAQGVEGGWERSISMFRTAFAFIAQSRGFLDDGIGGVVWYAHDSPDGSVFVPFGCQQTSVPLSYTIGKQSVFDPQSAWWAFNFVNNWRLLRYNAMSLDIGSTLHVLQTKALEKRQEWEGYAQTTLKNETNKVVQLYLQKQSNAFATEVVSTWWALAWKLVAKYSDGYLTTGEGATEMKSPGYPAWWLKMTEFSTWPGASFHPRQGAFTPQTMRPVSDMAAHPHPAEPPAMLRSVLPAIGAILGWILFGVFMGVGLVAFAQRQQRRRGYAGMQ